MSLEVNQAFANQASRDRDQKHGLQSDHRGLKVSGMSEALQLNAVFFLWPVHIPRLMISAMVLMYRNTFLAVSRKKQVRTAWYRMSSFKVVQPRLAQN